MSAHTVDAPFTDLGGEHRAEAVPPQPDGFVTDIDAAFCQKVSTLRNDSGI